MQKTSQIKLLLKQYFGYNEFRPGQEAIINRVLENKDTLVLMPTGGGKSLCFQLPALCFKGLTLVISPLIALMKDQVDSLRENGIPASLINSSLSYMEIEQTMQAIKQGQIKLLYIAPERLAKPDFKEFLQTINISLIAVDEAHCISEWGHDFRPEYHNLSSFRQLFSNVPVLALTASATPKVQTDIIHYLSLNKASIFKASFDRHNLQYTVIKKNNPVEIVLQYVEKYKNESTIIYCTSRKKTEKLALDLQEAGHSALPYHAGLGAEQRKNIQESFIKDETNIITATIAFGMGIDKPDVRLVIHYSLPKSIEGYYQETGRAGRDGLPSECVLLYSYGDKAKQEFFIRQISEEKERIHTRHRLEQMINFSEGQMCRRKFVLDYFGENYGKDNCELCDVCLNPVEEFNATEVSRKILLGMIQTGERFGISYITNVLCGSKNEKLKRWDHHNLSSYGCIKDYTQFQVKDLIRMLVQKGLVKQVGDEYPTLQLTVYGKEFLDKNQEINLPQLQKIVKVSNKKSKKTNILDYNVELFTKLRELRKEIANERGVPPFVIFGDVSLQEMAYYFPKSLDSFRNIFGVGEEKLKQFSYVFLECIKEHALQNNLEEKQKAFSRKKSKKSLLSKVRAGSTYMETKRLINEKASLNEIAIEKKISIDTVLSHLEKLKEFEKLGDISYLKPYNFIEISEAFKKSGGTLLKPVMEILQNEYGYEELRLARLFL